MCERPFIGQAPISAQFTTFPLSSRTSKLLKIERLRTIAAFRLTVVVGGVEKLISSPSKLGCATVVGRCDGRLCGMAGESESGKTSLDSRRYEGSRAVAGLIVRLKDLEGGLRVLSCTHVHYMMEEERCLKRAEMVVRVSVIRSETCRAKLPLRSILITSERPKLVAKHRQPPGNNAAGFNISSAP